MNYTHLIKTILSSRCLAICAVAASAVNLASAAVTWHDVQFGGFASQGYLVNSGQNDYLGNTSDGGTFDFREYAANASYSIGKFRFGAQAFAQKLGSYGDDKIKLDWATVDFQATQWFGVRAGRVKMPHGLYNEALDLDSVRPFVLLPQSVYDNRLRDFNAAFNGGMIYGNISLKRYGSLDYRLFYGDIPISANSGASDYFNNDIVARNDKISMDSVSGGSLFWNTPMAGLRVGYSFSRFKNMKSDRSVFSFSTVPYLKTTSSYDRHLVSVEYITGDWTFAAEAGREQAIYNSYVFTSFLLGNYDFKSDSFYLSAARRINSWLELGAYYSHSRDTEPLVGAHYVNAPVAQTLDQGDYALSAKFDLNEHVVFKLEGHYMDGSGKIFDTVDHPQPLAARDNSWTMLAAKLTFSF